MLIFFAALIDDEKDKLTFEHIYDVYQLRMLHIALGILKNQQDAEDAVQETLLKIARTIKSVPAGNEKVLNAYVYTAIRNTSLTILSAKENRVETVDYTNLPIIGGADPFEVLAQIESYDALQRLIDALPTQYREVLMLRYAVGLKPKQIGILLGRKIPTVQQQITRGKQLLTQAIRQKGGKDYVE